MRCIGISGTPGTGKSSVAKELSLRLQAPVVELSNYVMENNLYVYYDEIRKSYVIDEDKVKERIVRLHEKEGTLIIVGHYLEILPREIFELVFVLRRNPHELINILKFRGWPDHKVAENVEAELLSVCTLNVLEELGEDIVVEVDTTSKEVSAVVDEIIDILFGAKPIYYGLRIDWLSMIPEDKLSAILSYIEKYRVNY
ncbi:MAG: adenylate kinase family protein [Ignisphaera sp.]